MDGQTNITVLGPCLRRANVSLVVLGSSDLLHLIENKLEAAVPPRLLGPVWLLW